MQPCSAGEKEKEKEKMKVGDPFEARSPRALPVSEPDVRACLRRPFLFSVFVFPLFVSSVIFESRPSCYTLDEATSFTTAPPLLPKPEINKQKNTTLKTSKKS